jgi:excisionase family DNA binding protein
MVIEIDGVEYLDGEEAARLLGVKKATLYAYVSRGIVQSYRQQVGRHRLYRRDAIDRLRAVAPERAVREEPAAFSWSALPPEAPEHTEGGLPQVADWAGDH